MMFLMLQIFIEMISDLGLSSRTFAWDKLPTPEDMFGKLQKDTLDDILLLLMSLSSWRSMKVWIIFFELWSVSDLCSLVDDNDFTNFLGIFESLDERDLSEWRSSCVLAWPPCCSLHILVDFTFPLLVSLASWETSVLVGDPLLW
jgi:hypothetical protein